MDVVGNVVEGFVGSVVEEEHFIDMMVVVLHQGY